MKIKKLLLCLLLVPLMFVALMSGKCDWLQGGSSSTAKVWFTPQFGEGNRCGGGAGGYEWNYTIEVSTITYDASGKPLKKLWKKTEKNGLFGVTSPIQIFVDVPSTGFYEIVMYSISTKCYRDAIGANKCPSRCARRQRIEYSDKIDAAWKTDVYITNNDYFVGPCC